MKKAKRILVYEINQYNDYLTTLQSTYSWHKASGLTPCYLGKPITRKQIESVKAKIKQLYKKFDKLYA